MIDKMDRKLLSRIIQVLSSLVLMAAVFFIAAGTLDVPRAWLHFALYFVYLLCNFAIFSIFSPNIIRERSEIKQGTKPWELVFAALYFVSVLLIYTVAGLDIRFGWSYLDLSFCILGVLLYAASAAFITWAMVSNKFFDLMVAKQEGREVATGGPYAFIRHPGYAGMIVMYSSASFTLGSAVSLIPAAILAISFIWRTYMEDRTLMKELKGYREYAKNVRYRLIPGIW
jgi:protein-S-isoprenylcysteine O-methyltransferase Ste14